MKRNYTILLLILLFFKFSFSQNTIGLLSNTDQAYDGYTLFTPEQSNSVYLVDNCGHSINTWTFSDNPKYTCYLLENGNLLRAGIDVIEIRDWDNNLIWNYNLAVNKGIYQHHDIEPLPNGNILCLVNKSVSEADQLALGKDPALLNGPLTSERIIEIEPVGTNNINIVWEWQFIDHLIQDYNTTIQNFGVVDANPQLADFNYTDSSVDHSDWLHLNSIDYNPLLDQILFSSRTLSEIFIIDHSTTTSEAASHSGGNQNKGGDFLWRWGNPQVYRQGTANDQKLNGQHDAKWIPENYTNEHKITVFNNNNTDGTNAFSSIHIISPYLDEDNNYILEDDAFLPTDYFWSWQGEILGETVYEIKKGGVQALENGNLLLCETTAGRLTEITQNGEIAWVYRNPVGTTVYDQYITDIEMFLANSIFRGEKYPKNYAAFTERDLTPGNTLENINTLSDACNTLSIYEEETVNKIAFTNPIENNTIQFYKVLTNVQISIYNALGQLLYNTENFNGNELRLDNTSTGIHFISIENNGARQIEKVLFK
ncbi:aryl-sulfate sulfotransferase [Formosa sp. L2A11]|uniref:aryl-sulfate sulfotransferase n=1 Tax=Formosa sp. L2A11 TaxID=2686363 RepID=UPI00131A7FEF|nr:aryl-sulfate sulfotransferase [Formosa sp. L2A11]